MNSRSIPYGRQNISEQDIRAVVDVLKSDWLTQGPAIERFEKAIAEYCNVRYAVAVNSATSALHISCLAAGLGEGDVLWTSPNTFVASANCALYCGATVDFVDIDPRTYNMSIDDLELKLKAAQKTGKLPKVLIPVHFAGQSCEMQKIAELSERYGFRIIEDASHAIGGAYRGMKIGSCISSDMTVFSFHPVKIITTGEGGMVLTNNKKVADKLALLRSHGVTRNAEQMTAKDQGPWYYEQIELGFNYRMTDIQAALGASQMVRLNEFVSRRHALAARYDRAFKGLPLTLPWQHPDCFSAYHLYVVRIKTDDSKKSHREIFETLRQKGIQVNLHYIPVHLHPYYRARGFQKGDFPKAERYFGEAISLPLYSGLTEHDQDIVISAVEELVA